MRLSFLSAAACETTVSSLDGAAVAEADDDDEVADMSSEKTKVAEAHQCSHHSRCPILSNTPLTFLTRNSVHVPCRECSSLCVCFKANKKKTLQQQAALMITAALLRRGISRAAAAHQQQQQRSKSILSAFTDFLKPKMMINNVRFDTQNKNKNVNYFF
jgi:hypothetical protein